MIHAPTLLGQLGPIEGVHGFSSAAASGTPRRGGRDGWKEGRWKIIGRKAIGREASRACISEHASFRGEACIGRVTRRLLLALHTGRGRGAERQAGRVT